MSNRLAGLRGRYKLAKLLAPFSPRRSEPPSAVDHETRSGGSTPMFAQGRTFPELPQELWDMVIDHLHDDKPALLTCRCVCRSWYPSSRYHLNGHIRLRAPFTRKVSSLPNQDLNDTDILVQIRHPNRISSLKVEWTPARDPSYGGFRYGIHMHNSLSRAVQILPHLVSLTLIGLRLHYPRHPSEGEKITHFLEAALQMPRLREVTLVGVTLAEYPDVSHVSSSIALAQSLQKLCIRESMMNGITLSWLYSLLQQSKHPRTARSSLRHLDIPACFLSYSMQGHFALFTSLLLDIGSDLHRLGVQLSRVHGANGKVENLSAQQEFPKFLEAISRCANLHCLDLSLYGTDQMAGARAVIEYLAGLSPPLPITEVTLALHISWSLYEAAELDSRRGVSALRALDNHLCRLGQIRVVTIMPTMTDLDTGGDSGPPETGGMRGCVEVLWKNLPKLRKRGILRVEVQTAST